MLILSTFPLRTREKWTTTYTRLTPHLCCGSLSLPLPGTLSCQFYPLPFFPTGLRCVQVSSIFKWKQKAVATATLSLPQTSLQLLPHFLRSVYYQTPGKGCVHSLHLVLNPRFFLSPQYSGAHFYLPLECLSLRFRNLIALNFNGHWSVFMSRESVFSP